MADIITTIQQHDWPKRVIMGVSGGVDSVVLLDAFAQARPQTEVVVAHVNYHFRSDSNQDESLVQRLAKDYGYDFQVRDYPDQPTGNLEGQARDFRYRYFEQLAKKYQAGAILVAHQADDQAETVLMTLIRGGQLAQLAGMNRQHSLISRPLLPFSRQEILAYARQKQLTWHDDQTNFDAAYTARNKVRLEVLPLLTSLNRQAVAHINDFAKTIYEDQALLDDVVADYLKGLPKNFAEIERKWQPRVLARWFNQEGYYQLSDGQLVDVLTLLRNPQKPTGFVDLSNGLRFVKNYDNFDLQQVKNFAKKRQEYRPVMLKLNEQQVYAGRPVIWTDQAPNTGVSAVRIQGVNPQEVLQLRPGQPGDKLALPVGHQRLRRLLINEKIPDNQRDQVAVLANRQGQVLAAILPNGKWCFSHLLDASRQRYQQWIVW